MYSTKIRTTDDAINAATERLASDVRKLSDQRESALSTFRQARLTLTMSIVD